MGAASILEVRNATLGFSFSWELMTLAPVGSHPDSTIVAAKFTGLGKRELSFLCMLLVLHFWWIHTGTYS